MQENLLSEKRDSEQVYLITRCRASPRDKKKRIGGRKERFKITLLIDAGKRVESKGNHRDALRRSKISEILARSS